MNLMSTIRYSIIGMMIFGLEITGLSAAGVGLNTTRIVFPQNSQSIPVTVRNSTENEEYLVQVYLTKTPSDSTQEKVFDILPPMLYLKPGQQRDVRITETSSSMNLPKDCESIYYLHARAIARSEKNSELDVSNMKGDVKIAIENVIKVFYRPTGLVQTSDKAQESLTFSAVQGGVQVTNNSPYYITLASLKVGNKHIDISAKKNNTMVAPFSNIIYPTTVNTGPITWVTINDLGGYVEHTKP